MQVGDFTTGNRCDCIGGIKLGYFLLYIAALVAEKLEIEKIELDDCTGKPGYYFGAAFECEDEECSPEELVGMACNVKECTREKLKALSCQGKACSFQFDIEELKSKVSKIKCGNIKTRRSSMKRKNPNTESKRSKRSKSGSKNSSHNNERSNESSERKGGSRRKRTKKGRQLKLNNKKK